MKNASATANVHRAWTVALPVALCLLLLTSAFAQKGVTWQRVTLDKVDLSILMPGKPEIEDRSNEDAKTGTKTLGQSAQIESKDRYIYMVMGARFNDAARDSLKLLTPEGKDPVAYFAESMVKEGMGNEKLPKGVRQTKAAIRSGGLSGTETTFSGKAKGMSKRSIVKLRILTDKHSLLMVMGAQTEPYIDAAALTRFLDSAQLGPLSEDFLKPAAPTAPKPAEPDAPPPVPAEPEKP